MNWLKGIVGYLWKIYFLLVVMITLLLLYPAYLILLQNERYFPLGFRLIRFQAKLILLLIGIRREVEGDIPNDLSTSYIICPNHSSYLDILMLYAALPNYFIFLGKKELGSVPIFNIFFKRMNIPIDRSNAKAAHSSIMKACEEMGKGHNVVIFPEGTIPETVPEMKAFKNGAFRVALQLNIPIVPVTFSNNYLLLEDNWKFGARSKPGKSNVFIHKPILIDEDQPQDLVSLREATKKIIASKIA